MRSDDIKDETAGIPTASDGFALDPTGIVPLAMATGTVGIGTSLLATGITGLEVARASAKIGIAAVAGRIVSRIAGMLVWRLQARPLGNGILGLENGTAALASLAMLRSSGFAMLPAVKSDSGEGYDDAGESERGLGDWYHLTGGRGHDLSPLDGHINGVHLLRCRRFLRQTRKDLAMTFKSPIWQPIAVVLSAINLVAVGFAAGEAQPWHAGVHAALALAFGLWAQRLRNRPRWSELPAGSELPDRLEAIEAEVTKLGQELSETQERLDFAERVFAQSAEARRIDPQR